VCSESFAVQQSWMESGLEQADRVLARLGGGMKSEGGRGGRSDEATDQTCSHTIPYHGSGFSTVVGYRVGLHEIHNHERHSEHEEDGRESIFLSRP